MLVVLFESGDRGALPIPTKPASFVKMAVVIVPKPPLPSTDSNNASPQLELPADAYLDLI
jgi:hypothetical protein